MFIYTHIRDTEIRDTPLPHFPHIKGVGILNPRQIIQWGFLFVGVMVNFIANIIKQQIQELENDCDMHIIGGDLFDRIPSMDELTLYFDFISGITIPTLIYDGNHEATRKNTENLAIWQKC